MGAGSTSRDVSWKTRISSLWIEVPFTATPNHGRIRCTMAFSSALAHSLADARPDVFWTDRPELRPTPRPALTGHGGRADLVIVGGGFTGLWAAIQAKEDDPSRDVVLLEAGRLGMGASGRNGGFVSPSLTHGLAQGVAQWPDEIATLERLASENFAGWQATLVEHGVEADFHLPGELTLALTEHQVSAVREAHDLHLKHGKPVGLLDAADSRSRVSSPLYRAGFFDPEVGLVDPARLVWGLAEAAEALGVRLHEDTTGHRLRRRRVPASGWRPSGAACRPAGSSSGPGRRPGCFGGSGRGCCRSTTTCS